MKVCVHNCGHAATVIEATTDARSDRARAASEEPENEKEPCTVGPNVTRVPLRCGGEHPYHTKDSVLAGLTGYFCHGDDSGIDDQNPSHVIASCVKGRHEVRKNECASD